ncbi:MAG: FAD-dependent oxidoreductase [Bacillota bacterium]|nr:FAD-dependent oxidoreductase [Bacillota bacterium]
MENNTKIRIAIIGSGVSGSAVAYFLHKSLREQVETVVFEKEDRIGGRIRSIKIGEEEWETGGSIIHSENQYLSRIVDELGLEKKKHVYNDIGIWSGESFPFRTGKTKVGTLFNVLVRYGTSLVKSQPLVKDMINKLSQIYILQEKGEAYSDPETLFKKLGLYSLSQEKSYDYFRRNGISDRFIHEFMNGVSRLNYGQDASMHGLVNLVSLAGASFGGYLFAIKGRNSQICEAMLQNSSAKVLKNHRVISIHKKEKNKYLITVEGGTKEEFDYIVIATPLEKAKLDFTNLELEEKNRLSRPYQVTNVTYVFGKLNPNYFGLAKAEQIPANILTQENENIPFSSIELCKENKVSGQNIYRIFSRHKLAEDLLNKLFIERSETKSLVWDAYPVLTPTAAWPSFVLEEGIYYVNAMESAISTMETEVMGSKNVVNLLLKDICGVIS